MRMMVLMTLLVVLSVSALAQSSRRASAVALKDIHGRSFKLSDYQGKVVLVNFWATWCQPCRTEIPDLIKKQREYRDKGLQILGLTYPPEKISEVRRFVRELRMNYPVAIGTKTTKTIFTSRVTLPMTVVIDRDGTVRDIIEGIMYEDEFDQKVKPLLGRGVYLRWFGGLDLYSNQTSVLSRSVSLGGFLLLVQSGTGRLEASANPVKNTSM